MKRPFAVIDRTVEWIITALFSLMVVVGGMQVVSRYLLKHSLSWSEECQKYLHIWMIFLAIPLAYKHGSHIGMNIVKDRLPKSVQFLLTILFDALWFVFGAAMVFYTRPLMVVARGQTSPGLGLRMDLVYSCVAVGGAYLALMAARNIVTHLGSIEKRFPEKEAN